MKILDLECVIVSVARAESQARERTSGPGRREEEWEEWVQHCEDEIGMTLKNIRWITVNEMPA